MIVDLKKQLDSMGGDLNSPSDDEDDDLDGHDELCDAYE